MIGEPITIEGTVRLVITNGATVNTRYQKGKTMFHMLQGQPINTDIARQFYGIEHLHSVMPEIDKILPFEVKKIVRVNPRTGHLRSINEYWLLPETIERYGSLIERELMRKVQLIIYWAKTQIRFKQAMNRFKPLVKEETMNKWVRDLYRH